MLKPRKIGKKSTTTKDIANKMSSGDKDDKKEGRLSTKHTQLAKGNNQKRKN